MSRLTGKMAEWDITELRNGLLFRWSRKYIAGALTLTVFISLVILGILNPVPIRAIMSEQTAVSYAFQALITSLITGVTLVVTINQLALSQELGPLGDQRNRMKESMKFRRNTEDILGGTSSPEPAQFLKDLIENTGEEASKLKEEVQDQKDQEIREDIEDFADEVIRRSREVSDDLGELEFGHFEVVRTALEYNYNSKLYNARRIQEQYEDSLNDSEKKALKDIEDLLELYGPAREHFKTIYFRSELIKISRFMIYAAVPALIVSLATVIYISPEVFEGAFLGVDNLIYVISASATLSLIPFLVLTSYILRIGTVAQRTLAMGPFIIKETQREHSV